MAGICAQYVKPTKQCHVCVNGTRSWVSYGNPICAQCDLCSCENLRCYMSLTYSISIWLVCVINMSKATSMCICVLHGTNMWMSCSHSPVYVCYICPGPYDSHVTGMRGICICILCGFHMSKLIPPRSECGLNMWRSHAINMSKPTFPHLCMCDLSVLGHVCIRFV